MEKVYESINNLVSYAKNNLMLKEKDVDYVKNTILLCLSLPNIDENIETSVKDVARPDELVKDFADACVNAKVFEIEDSLYFADVVMGILSLKPSEIQNVFENLENTQGKKAATEWFYDYCIKNDYVKKSILERNLRFEENGLIITINKAKPEFRDSKKAAEGNKVKGGYPKCNICHENEGYHGRNKRTLRTIDMVLDGENWFWQFSPYGYFNEHGILVNYLHTPMHIDRSTYVKLLEFVDRFPHYFVGSNAALPRIGGSVLAHDHFQGGGEVLPLQKAKAIYSFPSKDFEDMRIEVLDWPGSAIKIVSKNKEDIVEISDRIGTYWKSYENKELSLIPVDEDGVHQAVSPTAIKTDRGYEMIIIFRSNMVSEKYPDGIFHAHPEFHIIKKESIGLIEAQGLFILPGRLEEQLEEIAKIISTKSKLPKDYEDFEFVVNEIMQMLDGNFDIDNVKNCIKKELGSICYRILENTAVFKDKKIIIDFLKSAKAI